MTENRKALWILGALALASILMAACGGANKGQKFSRGPMPEGGDFDGVYQSDFGRLEISVQDGSKVLGYFEDEVVHGRLEGRVNGNLLHFSWVQWKEDMQGKLRETRGRGVFQYVINDIPQGDKIGKEHRLNGTWGFDNSETGNAWHAYKMLNSKKRLEPFDPKNANPAPLQVGTVGFEQGGEKAAPPGEEKGKIQDKAAPEEKKKGEEGGSIDDIF